MRYNRLFHLAAIILFLGPTKLSDGLLLNPSSSILRKPQTLPPPLRWQQFRPTTTGRSSSLSAAGSVVPITTTAAKIAVGVMGLSTTISTLAPARNLQIFGFESTKTSNFIMLEIGAVGHSLFLMLYLQLFQHVPFLPAAAYHFVPYLYKNIHCHLNGKFIESGSPKYFGPITTALALLTASSCFYFPVMDTVRGGVLGIGELAIKAFSILTCLKGLAAITLPHKFLKHWNSSESHSTATDTATTATEQTNVHMLHLMGWTWLAHGVYLGTQAWNHMSPVQALGSMMAVFTASVASPSLVSKVYDNLNIPKGKFLAYLVFGTIITIALFR